jgi:mevalonate kinase
VASINKRIYVKAILRQDKAVRISALDLKVPGLIVTYTPEEVLIETDYGESLSAVAYLNKAIQIVSKYLDTFKGVDIEVKSEMPVGAGLGTSAAVSVATVAAYSYAMGYELTKKEIAKLGWQVEKEVQGIASPMDTAISTYGGFIRIQLFGKDKYDIKPIATTADLPIVIGYVERQAKTKDMVEQVKKLKDRYPDVVDGIMDLIGAITDEAEKVLRDNDLVRLGELMNMNHGLLDALGVSTKKLSEMVYAARSAGALGAKLTGAGGGGCVIALSPEKQEAVEVAMNLYGSMTLKTDLGAEGIVIKKV